MLVAMQHRSTGERRASHVLDDMSRRPEGLFPVLVAMQHRSTGERRASHVLDDMSRAPGISGAGSDAAPVPFSSRGIEICLHLFRF